MPYLLVVAPYIALHHLFVILDYAWRNKLNVHSVFFYFRFYLKESEEMVGEVTLQSMTFNSPLAHASLVMVIFSLPSVCLVYLDVSKQSNFMVLTFKLSVVLNCEIFAP